MMLKNKDTGQTRSFYSPDARTLLGRPDTEWEFVRRLGRTARMVERGVAAEKTGSEGAVEFHGDRVLQEDARKAVEPTKPDPLSTDTQPATETEKKEIPQAPRGSRGGGKQEPAKAKPEDG